MDTIKNIYDEINEEINKIPQESLKKKMFYLANLNKEKGDLESSGYEKEYNDMKKGYDAKYREIYEQVAVIVNGDKNAELNETESTKYSINSSTESTEKGIADFWSLAIKNSKYFPKNTKDEEILKHLKEIKLIPLDGNEMNYKIDFDFSPNDFFTETLLSKTFLFNANTEEIEKSTGTQIHWTSQDKNPQIKVTTKKVKKRKKSGNQKN